MKMTKKKVFLVSLSIVGILTILDMVGVSKICGAGNISCRDNLSNIFTLALPFLPVLFFSLITYKLREEVFRTWLHFAYWWVPLSIFFISVDMTGGSGGFGMGGNGELAAFIFVPLFVIISTMIILYQYTSKKKLVLYLLSCIAFMVMLYFLLGFALF
jgi:hypothetical protein